MDMIENRKTCCFCDGAITGTHLRSRFLGLVFGKGALPVMLPYVWPVTIGRAHHRCLLRVRTLSPTTFFSLLSPAAEKDVLGVTF